MDTINFLSSPVGLKSLANLKANLLTTNSSSAKKSIAQDYIDGLSKTLSDSVCYYIDAIFDKHIKFGVTSLIFDGAKKHNTRTIDGLDDAHIIGVLKDGLSKSISMASFKSSLVEIWCNLDDSCSEILECMLDKDFKCGVSTSVYKSIFSNKDTMGCSLADKYNGTNADFLTDIWYASRKLDGCRLNIVKTGGIVKTLSREQNEFTTLDVLKKKIAEIDGDFVLDGEVTTSSGLKKDDFKSIVSQIKRKDYTIADPIMLVFDILTIDEVYGRTQSPVFSERYEKLKKFFSDNKDVLGNNFVLVDQWRIHNEQELNDKVAIASKNGWEGVMLRKDVPWEGKRSKNLLKVKSFLDDEFVIKGCEIGSIRVGGTTYDNVLSAVRIDVDGSDVSVGSGFDLDERIKYGKNPESLIGKTIKVKYFEKTENKNGGVGLRFPVKIYIYDGQRFD